MSDYQEIISPEGLEERVEREETYRITLTQGGKYRTYHVVRGKKPMPVSTHETFEEARRSVAKGMVINGLMVIDAEKALKLLLDEQEQGKGAP